MRTIPPSGMRTWGRANDLHHGQMGLGAMEKKDQKGQAGQANLRIQSQAAKPMFQIVADHTNCELMNFHWQEWSVHAFEALCRYADWLCVGLGSWPVFISLKRLINVRDHLQSPPQQNAEQHQTNLQNQHSPIGHDKSRSPNDNLQNQSTPSIVSDEKTGLYVPWLKLLL